MKIKLTKTTLNNPRSFCVLTNNFCLIGKDVNGNFYNNLKENLPFDFPIIPMTVGGVNTIGNFIVANSNIIFLSSYCTDQEFLHLRNSLPDQIEIYRFENVANTIGNYLIMSDKKILITSNEMAFSKGYVDEISKSLTGKTLTIQRYKLNDEDDCVGSFVKTSNFLSFIYAKGSEGNINELSNKMNTWSSAISINKGDLFLGQGMIMNDFIIFVGNWTTEFEIAKVKEIIQSFETNNFN